MNNERRLAYYLSRVKRVASGCLEWQGCRNKEGYGRIAFHGRVENAHRVFFTLLVKPIPKGQHVLHTCDRPCCVNPEHLYLGTQVENQRDRSVRGRYKRAKLDADAVRKIRELYKTGKSQQAIALEFGVAQKSVSLLLCGVTWKWVT